jgi:mannose-6-phosphate isomerase-like protein (cupin superfamily)
VSYTIKNLREVEDSAPKFGFEDTQEAHFAQGDLDAKDTGVSFHVVKPGCRQGFAHRHEAAEEVYVVIAGSGRVKLDAEVAAIGTLDAIRVAPTVARAFEAGPDGLELVAFGPHHAGDGEILQEDFWGDA